MEGLEAELSAQAFIDARCLQDGSVHLNRMVYADLAGAIRGEARVIAGSLQPGAAIP